MVVFYSATSGECSGKVIFRNIQKPPMGMRLTNKTDHCYFKKSSEPDKFLLFWEMLGVWRIPTIWGNIRSLNDSRCFRRRSTQNRTQPIPPIHASLCVKSPRIAAGPRLITHVCREAHSCQLSACDFLSLNNSLPEDKDAIRHNYQHCSLTRPPSTLCASVDGLWKA